MIEDNVESRYVPELPERPNLDFDNAEKFFVAGNEYDYGYVHIFIDKPDWNVDDQGRTYWRNLLKGKREYFGMHVPKFIAESLGFPDFDGSRSIIKINESPKSYFEKKGFSLVDGKLVVGK